MKDAVVVIGAASIGLATMPADELLALPILQADRITDPFRTHQILKHAKSLRDMLKWSAGARSHGSRAILR